jgi:hypothetical protein
MWHGEEFYCPDPLVDWMVGYGLSMDPCWGNMAYLLFGSLYPLISIKGSILEINHLLNNGIHTGDGVLMAGYNVIAVWIREVWSG